MKPIVADEVVEIINKFVDINQDIDVLNDSESTNSRDSEKS